MRHKLFTASAFFDLRRPAIGIERATACGVLCLLAVMVCASPVAAQEKSRWNNEMRLNLVNSKPSVSAIHPSSGWQLTVDMQAKNRSLLGIGVAAYPPAFPFVGVTGYLVFDDPDHCPSFIDLWGQYPVYINYYCYGSQTDEYPDCVPPDWGPILLSELGDECPAGVIPESLWDDLLWPKDETWAEFTPGLSLRWPVAEGDFVPIENQDEEEPELWVWGSECDDAEPPNCAPAFVRRSYGPDLGTVGDDVRYGSWSRMPGLVVVADHGPGVRINLPGEGDTEPAPDYFDLIEPREAWNLAGFFLSSAYSLKGGTRETSLMAHMNVPYGLFTPVILFDNNISNPTPDEQGVLCGEDDALYRKDGGPLTCKKDGGGQNITWLVAESEVTVRVFMLDGVAPDILEDMDGNGIITVRDAELMGYDAISNEEKTRFTEYHEYFCGHPYDFDGNGIGGSCVLGARPGGLTRPPR